LWISYTGTAAGESAEGDVTVRCIETGEEWTIPIAANTVPRPTVAVVLALDQSNSMNFDSGLGLDLPTRGDVLKFGAPPFVEVIQEMHAIGVVAFDHDAYRRSSVTQVGAVTFGAGRTAARTAINEYAPNPEGWTSIGDALELCHNELSPVAGYDIKATVILTDGHETAEKYISEVSDLINERVYAIGLGTAEVIQPATLNVLTNGTGGYMLMTGDMSDDFFRLAKYYMQILAGVTNQDIILDPDGWLVPGEVHRIPFQLSETDISADVILLSTHPSLFSFMLESPNGKLIDPASPGVLQASGNNVSYYRINLPVPLEEGETREGTWHAVLGIKDKEKVKVRSYALRESNPSSHVEVGAIVTSVHGLKYSLSVHTYSNLKMIASEFQTSYEIGSTMNLRIALEEYGLPVRGRATLRIEMERPDRTTGILVPTEVEPGVFETTIPATIPGVYRFRVRASGATLQGNQFTREQILTGTVYRGGDATPPSGMDGPLQLLRRLCSLRCIRFIMLLLILLVIEALLVIMLLFQ